MKLPKTKRDVNNVYIDCREVLTYLSKKTKLSKKEILMMFLDEDFRKDVNMELYL